jgi:hypothetical protein
MVQRKRNSLQQPEIEKNQIIRCDVHFMEHVTQVTGRGVTIIEGKAGINRDHHSILSSASRRSKLP